ncbi:DUF4345 family protein [Phaeobacter gallaeciensis]|uniref:DUF4345 family protein n=1 Tax=Phaeobacter gallaeciensis TaxID=60890 RepID=UPI000BC02E72|nr:DUF4345 family protein [Phaeobacter gallaeciensis]ATF20615.1 Domain protein of unknown function [Phaeobacter gallaeciensis]ATF24724.1 Domain protein of unknown function [Phaeobacter gallaeciensis]
MSTSTQRLFSKVPRAALLLCGLIMCLAAVAGALDPSVISGTSVLAPDGITSIRVDFGGFHLGLGLFALYGVAFPSFLKPGLTAVCTTLSLVVLTRLAGMGLDGVNDAQTTILSRELVPFALSWIGLLCLVRQPKPAIPA